MREPEFDKTVQSTATQGDSCGNTTTPTTTTDQNTFADKPEPEVSESGDAECARNRGGAALRGGACRSVGVGLREREGIVATMLSAVFAAHKLHTPRQEAVEAKKAYVHRSVLGSSRHCECPSCPAPDPLQRGKSGRAEADVAATKADVAAVEEFAVAPVQADNTATMQWGLSAEVVCCRGRRCESKPSTPLPDTGEEPLSSAPPILGRRPLSCRYGKCNTVRLNRAPKLFSSHCSLEARMSKRSRRDGESIRDRSTSIATEEVNTAGSHSWKMKPHLLRLVRQSACRGGVFVCQLFGSRQSPRSVNEISKQERI